LHVGIRRLSSLCFQSAGLFSLKISGFSSCHRAAIQIPDRLAGICSERWQDFPSSGENGANTSRSPAWLGVEAPMACHFLFLAVKISQHYQFIYIQFLTFLAAANVSRINRALIIL
jgi:hypothetical protein